MLFIIRLTASTGTGGLYFDKIRAALPETVKTMIKSACKFAAALTADEPKLSN